MNTYYKYAPNVFLAKCEEAHEKGEIIEIATKYSAENECIVFNLIAEKDGFFYYSVVRADGFNVQELAKRKAEKLRERAVAASKRSADFFEKSNKDRDFLIQGEPIKVGHHSEKRHRKAYEQAWANTGNMVEEMDKAVDYAERANRWDAKTDTINLSMPESLEYYADKLEDAKEYHAGLKSGKYPKEHSFSMQYANKRVKELQKNYDLSVRLWGE